MLTSQEYLSINQVETMRDCLLYWPLTAFIADESEPTDS